VCTEVTDLYFGYFGAHSVTDRLLRYRSVTSYRSIGYFDLYRSVTSVIGYFGDRYRSVTSVHTVLRNDVKFKHNFS